MVTTTTNLTTRRTVGRYGSDIDLIAIHTMEAPEGLQTAENVANYFKTVNASSHWCVDSNSRVRVVHDQDMSWTLPGAQARSLNLEMAGYARQTPTDWADRYSIDMLDIAALCAAEWVIKYGIPVRHLTDDQIRAGAKGFVGHVDVNRVYKKSTHWDPGPSFPWNYFLGRVNAFLSQLDGRPTQPSPIKPVPTYNNVGYSTAYISEIQTLLNKVGYSLVVDGKRGSNTLAAIVGFQTKHGLVPDGIPGPITKAKLLAVTTGAPRAVPNCTGIQASVRALQDNKWGNDTDQRCDAVREASVYHGHDFPWGVHYTQRVVGTADDGNWGPKSEAAHDATVAAIQRALVAMGFDAGSDDGIWGERTERAYLAARTACYGKF